MFDIRLELRKHRVTFVYPVLDALGNPESHLKTIVTYAVGYEQAERFARARLSWGHCNAPVWQIT